VTTWLADYLAPDWPGCAPVSRLERERRSGGEVEREVVYGITSVPRERAGAAGLLRLIRAHWGIEDGRRGRRDGTPREDASRVRRGAASQVMAALRNLIIYLRPRSGRPNRAAATRYHMGHPEKSLELPSSRR
jgi:hypothetical protein